MAHSITVSRRIKRKAPRAFLKRIFKQKKPRFRLETCCDLLGRVLSDEMIVPLVWELESGVFVFFVQHHALKLLSHYYLEYLIHLNCLLFVQRLAQESRTNACESKSGVIKKDHVLAAAKVILKKSKG